MFSLNSLLERMMDLKFYQLNCLTRFIARTLTVAAIAFTPTTIVMAKSATEIAQFAQQIAVQINSNGDSVGGTGVIVAKEGNTYTVLTANHVACSVLQGRSPIVCRSDIAYTVRTPDGKEYATIAIQPLQKTKEDADLAIVKFESAQEYPVATVGDSEQAKMGTQIYVFGYPSINGSSGSQRDFEFSPGFVTSRPSDRPEGYTLRYNAVTKKGMSGGPVFDTEGRIVGIHGQGEADGQAETGSGNKIDIKSGWSAAIPVNTFMAVAQPGLNGSSLKVDKSPPSEKPVQIDNPTATQDYSARGALRQEQGDYKGAEEDFVKVLQQRPDRNQAFLAYFNRGNIRYQERNYKAALDDYTAAIKNNPTAAIVYHNRAVTSIKLGNYQNAIADWTQALQHDAGDALTYYNRGVAYSRTGNRQAAIADYTKAVQIDRNYAAAYNARGNNRSELGDTQQALEDFSQTIKIDPGFADAYNNRAVIRAASGDRSGAIEDLRKAAQLLLDRGKTAQYQQVMENLRKLESSNSSQPSDNSQSATAPRFTFTNILEYSNCLEDIVQISQAPEQLKQQGRKSNCLVDVFQKYENTGISQSVALELVEAANNYATSAQRTAKIFPPKGLRLKIAQIFGFVYQIDAQNENMNK